ncbi:MAG: vWA domain-containing protein, partial [Candidatus Faecousia sp.]|nr:vWA domain-containing protein [Candidatus Faecousia sp.]
ELQVMFLVDTTGSMADEISYLQKDFSAITQDVGSSGVRYAACFYRDEGDDYVTRMNPFTSDVSEVQVKINSEYADGGGDNPEAVAPALTEAVSADQGWSESAEKLLFLIFDAPPHDGTEAALDAAIRSAAAQGIRVIPVVASNADRATELFGRAAAIVTNGTYVFLTDDSGVGGEHLEPIVGSYDVELLHDVIVRIINEHRPG